MLFKGRTLILDNFRSCLSKYSVDIQDVVRSAILDGVDITKYIDVCKDNPFRLDQIRLGIKEGLDTSLFSLDGDVLYRVRKLRRSGNIGLLTKQLSKGSLSDEHISHLLDWIQEGRSIEGIEMAIIPKNLLSVYDLGLSYGVDMSIFNNVHCTPEYLEYLVGIAKNKRPVEKFLDCSKWSTSVLHCVMLASSNHMGWYDNWVSELEPSMSYDVVEALRQLHSYMIRLDQSKWVSAKEMGTLDDKYIEVLVKVAKDGMNLRKFLGLDRLSADSLYMEMKQGTKQKISGNIRGKH